jgi:hypothetical protein
MWLAGSGLKRGLTYGATDEWASTWSRTPSTPMTSRRRSCTCADHERLTFHLAGRDYRLTDVHDWVVRDILA